MKTWGWFAIAIVWLFAVLAVNSSFLDFLGFGIYVPNWMPINIAMGLLAALFGVLSWGWIIPLSIGFKRLVVE